VQAAPMADPMTDKERFDSFMRVAELRTLRATNRQSYEWRVTLGLWAVITAATIYLKDRPVPLWLGVSTVFIYAFFWLRAINVAHWRDNQAAAFYIETALSILSPGRKRTGAAGEEIRWESWLFGFLFEWGCLFQLLSTIVLIYFFYLMTNPGALPEFLHPPR
jgi:hypothetical protein